MLATFHGEIHASV